MNQTLAKEILKEFFEWKTLVSKTDLGWPLYSEIHANFNKATFYLKHAFYESPLFLEKFRENVDTHFIKLFLEQTQNLPTIPQSLKNKIILICL